MIRLPCFIYCVLFLCFFVNMPLPFGLLATHSSDDEFICQVFPPDVDVVAHRNYYVSPVI